MLDMNELLGMKGKTVIVTGSGSGIGAGTSKFFAEAGCRVMLVDHNVPHLKENTAALLAEGLDVCWHECDAATMSDAQKTADDAYALWGRIDCLVNCVGATQRATVEDLKESDWDRVIDITLKSVYLMCHCVVPYMKKQGHGKIVNIGSGWSLKGGNKAVSYCASKGGVWNMTRALAIDCGPYNINVNCVCPGDIDTKMLRHECEQLGGVYDESFKKACAQRPIARLGTPRDVAMCVFFLCSEMAPWVTGSSLVVDGGGIA